MNTRQRRLLRLDLEAIDLRRGLSGLLVLGIAVAIVFVFGPPGVIAGLAALFVIMTDRPGPLRARGLAVVLMTGLGAVIGGLALWSGTENVWVATILTFGVAAAGTLVAGLGHSAAIRGLLLTIWAIVALSFGGDVDVAVQLTFAYIVGGLIAAAVVWLRVRADAGPSITEQVEVETRRFEHILRSPLGWFAVLRATAVALAMASGAILFPDHPIWAALTVAVVMRPKAGESVAIGVLRTIGTLVGVVVAEVVLALSGGEDVVILLGSLAAGFGAAALGRVNYAVSVGCLTALLVLASELVGASGQSAAVDRLAETILGAIIAFGAMAIGRWLLARQAAAGEADPAVGRLSGQDDEVPG
jgi:ABC-type multidrug transport system fused ATPase/permease subunit